MPPVNKVRLNLSTPPIKFESLSGSFIANKRSDPDSFGRWHFADYFCGYFDSEYRLGIGQLSKSLAILRSFSNYQLPADEELLIVEGDFYNLKIILREVLNCFAPDMVDPLSAAILTADKEAFQDLMALGINLNQEFEVKDRSWVLVNNYTVNTKQEENLCQIYGCNPM